MKKAILLLSIYFFATGLLNVSQAQSFQWLTRMGGPDSDLNFDPDEWVRDIEVDADGNVYACGRIRSIANFGGVPVTTYGGYDMFLCKYDCHGNLVWVKTAGGLDEDDAGDLVLDNIGHIYLTGRISSTPNRPCTFFDTTFTDVHIDMFLAKFDTSGNYLWIKAAGTAAISGGSRGFKVLLDSNGQPVVSFGSSPGLLFPGWNTTEPNTAPYISRFDTSGIMQSIFTFSTNYSVGAYCVTMDSQDNYILNSYFTEDSVLVGNQTIYNPKPGSYQALVFKFSNSGIFDWSYMFTDTTIGLNGSLAFDCRIDANDNIFVTGLAYIGLKCGNFVFTDPIAPSGASPFLIKLSPLGQPVWATQVYVGYSGKIDSAMPDNLTIAKEYRGLAIVGNDTLQDSWVGAGNDDAFIARFDSNGNALNAVRLTNAGATEINAATKDNLNNIYIAGSFSNILTAGTHSVQSAGGHSDGFIAKYGYNCTTGMSPDLTAATVAGISVWPNPVAKGEAVTFATAITNGSYSVINMMGLEITTGRFQKGKGTLSTQALAAGVYTVVIRGLSNMGTARLVVVE